MRILFLDDDPARRRYAIEHCSGHEIHCVETAEQPITALRRRDPFDVISLDHGLGRKAYQPSDEKSGYGVACWLERRLARGDEKHALARIIVHSYNNAGARRMMQALRGYRYAQRSIYGGSEYWELLTLDMASSLFGKETEAAVIRS